AEAAPRSPQAEPDPFAAPASEAKGDPFAAPASEAKGDPFAAPASEAKGDPFAPPEVPASPDPFAEPAREEPAGRGPAPEPEAPAATAPDPFAAADLGAEAEPPTAEPAADVAVGGGASESVDAVLGMLREQGLFEPPSGEAAQWAGRAEVKKGKKGSGTSIGLWLGIAWVLAIGLAVGGWFGWQAWVDHRHAQAAALVAQATEEAYRGDHADLVDAERHLREARALDAHDRSGPTLLLFVHSQLALEDGAFEAGFMRPSLARAERLQQEEENAELAAYLDAARAVVAAAEGGHEEARTRIGQALEARPRDPAILYLAGRLEQRLGGDDALEHLEAATQGEAELNAARVALAEARYDQGQAEEALALLDEILASDDDHLRATLWRAYMTSDTTEPAEGLATLGALEEDLEQHGAPTDQVLHALTRSRLLRRQGETEAAGQAVDAALQAGATEPRLLALVASEGRRSGRMLRAEQAARTAVNGAPSNPEFRKLLAEIQIARRNGRAALGTLQELPDDDPDVLEMRAEAALLLGSEEALTTAAEGLDAYVEAHEDASIAVRALRIRMHARAGEAREMLSEARALVREAPGDPHASMALGETALRLYDAETAVESLASVVQASPDDAEGHYLLGRAHRMAGAAEEAEESLRRAVELTPEHTEARLALGGLLLDMGQFEEADELYRDLAQSAGVASGQALTVAGRLGRVEALIGLDRLDDAQVQLEALQESARETPSARITAARLKLAQGQAGDALSQLRPLARGETPSASVLALYGDALLAAGQGEAAAQAYEQALEADAGSPEALLGQAAMAARSERGDDALELLERVGRVLEVRIRPPALHARMHLLVGRAHLAEGHDEAAREALRRAAEIETAPPAVHFWLGEALAGDNSPDARAAYERYLELAPEGDYAARARRAIR
ncbi:MAG TPA: tetratricopeptide repeat protein, partial [Sandaracinaceae bacterium LLY-WYZ-13_1]|nr:tetratricopeptide repeat protein [Sandaracinaceae bacterium LLY-WYZ-13_1]